MASGARDPFGVIRFMTAPWGFYKCSTERTRERVLGRVFDFAFGSEMRFGGSA